MTLWAGADHEVVSVEMTGVECERVGARAPIAAMQEGLESWESSM
jgi:hypothetical protein